MSETVEKSENAENESLPQVSASTVEAEYELFNKELGLDEVKENYIESTTDDANDEAKEPPKEDLSEDIQEPEEPISDDEVIADDVDDWDEDGDPEEIEIEPYALPEESVINSNLLEQSKKRRIMAFPVTIKEMGHPSVMEVLKKAVSFKTSFVQCRPDESNNDNFKWKGMLELSCQSSLSASEAIEMLKTVREDLTVRLMEPSETGKNIMGNWVTETDNSPYSNLDNLLIVRPIKEDVTLEQLRDHFPEAADIMITKAVDKPHRSSGKLSEKQPRSAYVFYNNNTAMDGILAKYTENRPIISESKVGVFKYRPPGLPQFFVKLRRRYKILLQIKKLKRCLRDTTINYTSGQRSKMKSTIEHCTSLLEKDEIVRRELGMKILSLQELRRIRLIRESVKVESVWCPKVPGTVSRREERYDVDLGDDDKDSLQGKRNHSKFSKRFNRDHSRRSPPPPPPSRHRWQGPRGSSSGVPSLMSVPMDGPIDSRMAQAMAHQLAQMACSLNPGLAGLRGGVGGNRGRSINHGRFGHSKGGGFGDGNMEQEGGPSGGSAFGNRRGGGFGGNFNKRSHKESSSERESKNSRDGPGIMESGSKGRDDVKEPAEKMVKSDIEHGSWSTGSNSDKPVHQQQQSPTTNRGRQSSWSRAPPKVGQEGGNTGSGFKPSSSHQGGFKRGGSLNQGSVSGGFSQGGGYNQNSGTFNQSSGGFNQGSGGGYNQNVGGAYGQGSGGFNQGGGGGYNQGSGGGYNQGSGGGHSQGSAAGYNQSLGGGYNQNTSYSQSSGFNQDSGYNQPSSGYQQGSGNYGSHGTAYSYNYPTQSPGGSYQSSQAPVVQSMTAPQTWNANPSQAQTYWQNPSNQPGSWQQTAPSAQPPSGDQNAYNYNWNTWK